MKRIIAVLTILLKNLLASAEPPDINQKLYDATDATDALDVEKVATLLDAGADPNWIKVKGKSTSSIIKNTIDNLYYESQSQQEVAKITSLLFEHGAKLTNKDNSILYVPVVQGAYDVTEILIKNGANASEFPAPNNVGNDITPVELAVRHSHSDIVELLVKNGAELPAKQDALQLRFVERAQFGSVPDMEDLLRQGAVINKKDKVGRTALIMSLSSLSLSKNASNFFFLLDAGADVNIHGKAVFKDDTTPLHVAVDYTSLPLNDHNIDPDEKRLCETILRSLLKAGAYVSARDETGLTPLHLAAKRNSVLAAQILLESDAKVMPRDGAGRTPLNYAESGEMIRLLKEYGAKELY